MSRGGGATFLKEQKICFAIDIFCSSKVSYWFDGVGKGRCQDIDLWFSTILHLKNILKKEEAYDNFETQGFIKRRQTPFITDLFKIFEPNSDDLSNGK
jgi:hypothetical protein